MPSAVTDSFSAHPLLLLPDFLLIALGFAICRWTALGRPVWDAAERLVYWLLFPVLLFLAIIKNPISLQSGLPLAAAGWLVTGIGILLGLALAHGPGVNARLHASGAQVAFRFNSYIALALAERLAGAPGVAWTALLIAVCVPVANIAAVWPLARHGGQGYLRELIRNPLIVATVAGLVCNLLGVTLPETVATTMSRIGAAALPLGLMAVGAGLQFGALREGPALAGSLLAIRHLVLPAVGLVLVFLLPLSPPQQAIVIAFAAMPTASSAYVLAVRMGGHGPFVAGLVTLSTLLAMAGLPLALMTWQALR
ncbi:MAG: AEC family transporter [Rubrivivax sp.]|jgi:predicted permease|nr:AEC family transporter [Rubrivivax sp.]